MRGCQPVRFHPAKPVENEEIYEEIEGILA
jgi:hypothetical protein